MKNLFGSLSGSRNGKGNAQQGKMGSKSRRAIVERLEDRCLLTASGTELAPILDEVLTTPAYTAYETAGYPINDVDDLVVEEGEAISSSTLDRLLEEAGEDPAALDQEFIFNLNSKPGSKHTIYLDFTGHITVDSAWNQYKTNGQPIITPAYDTDGQLGFSNSELRDIYEIWLRVSEDYMPFDVNVTTKEPTAEQLAKDSTDDEVFGTRVAIGGSCYDWYSSSSGVAYVGSFGESRYQPAFVFPAQCGTVAYLAEAVSHETGHTLGLRHDGTSEVVYYKGHDGWMPIMGSGSQALSQWSKGEYDDADNQEDDLAIIAGVIGYRADDVGSSFTNAKALDFDANGVIAEGIIGRNTDVDYYSFQLTGKQTSLTVAGIEAVTNLDVIVKLYDANKSLVATYDPSDSLGVTIDVSGLAAGKYYIAVAGTGLTKDGKVVYSDYGSLGAYTITAKVSSIVSNTYSVSLSGAQKVESKLTANVSKTLSGQYYRWYVSDTADGTRTMISGATSKTYTVPEKYLGKYITVVATWEAFKAEATTSAIAKKTLSKPVVVSKTTDDSIKFAWNDVSSASSYQVYYKKSGASSYTSYGVVTNTNITLSGLEPDTIYEIKVRALGDDSTYYANSAYTIASAATKAKPVERVVDTVKDGIDYNDGKLSLREAINEANDGDRIVFSSSLGSNVVIKVDSILLVNKGITIDGQNRVTLDGQDKTRIMTVNDSTPEVEISLKGLTFRNGYADSCYAGAIYLSEKNVLNIEDCRFYDNEGYYNGGAIYIDEGTLNIDRCVFYNNAIHWCGGAIGMFGTGTLTASNSVFYANTSESSGGALSIPAEGSAALYNCTIAGNTAEYAGGIDTLGELKVYNTIVSQNKAVYSYNNIYGALKASGNNQIDAVPGFVVAPAFSGSTLTNASTIDLHLKSTSGAVNTGNNSYVQGYADVEGKERIIGTKVDIGAYEYGSSALSTYTVSISGTQTIESTLTAKVSESVSGLSYQWYVSSTATGTRTAISGATSSTYTVAKSYVGKYITVVATKGSYQAEDTTDAIAKRKLTKPTVTASSAEDSIALTWNKISGASSYEVQYKKSGASSYTSYGSVTGTSCTLTGLDTNTTYSVRVRAVGSATYYEKSVYDAVDAATKDALEIGKPSAVKQTSSQPISVTISWTAGANADYYIVKVYNSARTKLIASYDDVETTSLKIEGLTKSTSYSIDVVAASNTLGKSEPVTFVAETSGIIKLNKPTVTLTPDANSLKVKWNSVPNAVGYQVSYKVTSASSWTTFGTVSGTSCALQGLKQNTSYTVRVKALGDAENYNNSDNGSAVATTGSGVADAVKLAKPVVEAEAVNNTLNLSWNKVNAAQGYQVQYKVTGASAYTDFGEVTATSCSITGLKGNTEYTIRVKAIGDGTNYKNSDYASLVQTTGAAAAKLSKPTLSGSASGTTLNVSWAKVANAKGYQVQYKLADSSSYVTFGTVSGTSCSISGLAANTDYVVRVKAIGDGTNYSNSDNASIALTTGNEAASKLAKPTLTGSASGTTLNVSWAKVANAKSYQVQYKLASSSSYVTVGTVSGTSCSISGLAANTDYVVRVKAIGDGVNYLNSDNASIALTTGNEGASKLAKPTLTGSASGTTLNVSWAKIANATGYQVQYKLADSSSYVTVGTVSGTSCSISGLAANTDYVVRVKAIGDGTNYLNSDNASVALTTGDEAAPKLSKPILTGSVSGTTINVSWSKVANATAYQVQYKLADSSSYVTAGTVYVTSFAIPDLEPNTDYVVRVKALGDGVNYLNSDNAPIALTTGKTAAAILDDAFAEFEYDELGVF